MYLKGATEHSEPHGADAHTYPHNQSHADAPPSFSLSPNGPPETYKPHETRYLHNFVQIGPAVYELCDKHTYRRIMHSVDSVASYSSQNHVDRIRTQNFSAASCHDEDFGSIKTSLFRRSSSNLEYSVKRPESVTSNTSSTRSRLREFVERKSSQDEHKSAANTVADIQYFENPTETLEFDKSHSSLDSKKSQDDRPKKRKLSKKESDIKNKKQEKYQSKLAEYYKVSPVQLPQDEFYQHLTKSRAAEEFLQRRFPNSDTEVSSSYGRLCKHKEVEGSNLRRSRSLAVIREETFTDLQLQNHTKNKRSQLIPRARLFDKPCFKDRLIGRAKYQTKEEVLEGIYIDSTVSCFGDISGQKEEPTTKICPIGCIEKEELISRSESRNSKVSGSWPNLNEESKQINLSEDSIGPSRNPSEIDSLDSNYVRKHYNFDAHLKNYNESSPETERSVTSRNNSQELYITTDDHDSEKGVDEKIKTPEYLVNNYTSKGIDIHFKEKGDINIEEIYIEDKSETQNLETDRTNKCSENNGDNRSVLSENDETISSPPDSITSYISISIASSTDRSHKLEHLANSLAEKIDEYCDSQYQSNSIVSPAVTVGTECQDTSTDPIYTSITKKTSFADIKRDSFNKASEHYKGKNDKENVEVYVTNTYIDCNTDIRDTQRRNSCTSPKNITTEPFVTTLIENQYYSLPDINISKCLRKSERIDAQLREEDPEDIIENTYGVNENHFREILATKSNENYGQLNKICYSNISDKNIPNNNHIYLPEYSEPEIIQNYSKLEDDLKSIITIESNNEQDCGYYNSDAHQNEREINEIEGTIRNNKLITKEESLKISTNSKIIRPEAKILKSLSNDNINKKLREKSKTGIRKHYSLRQRDPTDDISERLPSPSTVENSKSNISSLPSVDLSFSEQIKNHSLLSRVQSFKTSTESHIEILPLSGHQTIVINPPITQSITEAHRPLLSTNINLNCISQNESKKVINLEENNNSLQKLNKETIIESENYMNSFDDLKNSLSTREPFITIKLNKVVKTTIPKLKSDCCDQLTNFRQKFHSPPSKLIIKDSNNGNPTVKYNMTRPQVIQVVDSTKSKKQDVNIMTNKDSKTEKMQTSGTKKQIKETKTENNNVKEKLNNAIKTDIEYQEKINSVKNYWSNLIEKTPESVQQNNNQSKDLGNKNKCEVSEIDNAQQNINNNNDCTPEVSVGSIIKSLESVKIVDSIRKLSQTKLQLWKDETEKVKSDTEIEEKPVEKIFKDNNNSIYDNSKSTKSNKVEPEICRDTPEIEIVELSSDDNQNQKTQATLIKAKGFEKGCDEFDHVRYKVMKSELFKNSMIANYKKEAQFDGLLQYLQDYSFQELLVNNNIVIIEPVRTKIEPAPRKNTNTDTCKIPPTLFKKSDQSYHSDKTKNLVRRHFFYHPIRVNKEIIEEELPNPDTVKKVRNLFEDTLKMKSPMTHDPPLLEENTNLTRRSTSYRNLSEETKVSKGSSRKKVTRHLTIDTNYGSKKWDNASLSSGVSSGDLSSTNEYETDGLSPYSQKNLKDNTYSSSDEYLCDSANQDLCCESQYVSPDILKKIRDCGTSVTYYGGKVLNSKTGSNVSPMTKAIMEEIKKIQRNCSRDCYSCQTKCKGTKCSCLHADKHQKNMSDKHNIDILIDNQNRDSEKRTDGFPGFKFKLVKSNSCSSRLELTGTDENRNARLKFRKQNSKEDPPLVCDEENSVKNKICRLESYSKSIANAPFQGREKNLKKDSNSEKKGHLRDLSETKTLTADNIREQESLNNKNDQEHSGSRRNSTQSNKQSNDGTTFEKKFYYVNDTYEQNNVKTDKFGEMVFEEFEVLESCYDSLNSNKSMT